MTERDKPLFTPHSLGDGGLAHRSLDAGGSYDGVFEERISAKECKDTEELSQDVSLRLSTLNPPPVSAGFACCDAHE